MGPFLDRGDCVCTAGGNDALCGARHLHRRATSLCIGNRSVHGVCVMESMAHPARPVSFISRHASAPERKARGIRCCVAEYHSAAPGKCFIRWRTQWNHLARRPRRCARHSSSGIHILYRCTSAGRLHAGKCRTCAAALCAGRRRAGRLVDHSCWMAAS